jgi:hypothetical protein
LNDLSEDTTDLWRGGMSLLISGDLRLHMPLFPTSPAPTNGDTWTDPVTSVSWTFQSSTNTWRLT